MLDSGIRGERVGHYWVGIRNQGKELKNSRKAYLRIEWEFKPVYLSVGSEFENLATSGVIVESGFNNLKRASRSMLTQVYAEAYSCRQGRCSRKVGRN